MDEIDLLRLKLRQLQEVSDWLQTQINSVTLEVNRTVSALIEERDGLRWRVDPFSSDAASLADFDDI